MATDVLCLHAGSLSGTDVLCLCTPFCFVCCARRFVLCAVHAVLFCVLCTPFLCFARMAVWGWFMDGSGISSWEWHQQLWMVWGLWMGVASAHCFFLRVWVGGGWMGDWSIDEWPRLLYSCRAT